ncbi:putative calcium-binding protein CML41 [Tasmannia lanceolata]|uniref:putative calcium-binding protein CML41 n=1 Tax=Tasmannia lanceolata TaxID=3420 RepID=UPI0040629BF2
MASKCFSNKSVKVSLPRPRPRQKSDSRSPKSGGSSSPPVFSPSIQANERTRDLQESFRYFDGDGDGNISIEELRSFFVSIGEDMSSDEAKAVIAEFDSDSDGLLDFQDFAKLMERDSGDVDDLRRAFEMFEVEKGSGCITPKGLQRTLNRLGDERSVEECEAMIRVFDLDGNGVLDFQEFHQMMAA